MDFWFSARRKPKGLSGDRSFGLTTQHWIKKTSSMRHFMIDWTLVYRGIAGRSRNDAEGVAHIDFFGFFDENPVFLEGGSPRIRNGNFACFHVKPRDQALVGKTGIPGDPQEFETAISRVSMLNPVIRHWWAKRGSRVIFSGFCR